MHPTASVTTYKYKMCGKYSKLKFHYHETSIFFGGARSTYVLINDFLEITFWLLMAACMLV
jgi:hypothetical protein